MEKALFNKVEEAKKESEESEKKLIDFQKNLEAMINSALVGNIIASCHCSSSEVDIRLYDEEKIWFKYITVEVKKDSFNFNIQDMSTKVDEKKVTSSEKIEKIQNIITSIENISNMKEELKAEIDKKIKLEKKAKESEKKHSKAKFNLESYPTAEQLRKEEYVETNFEEAIQELSKNKVLIVILPFTNCTESLLLENRGKGNRANYYVDNRKESKKYIEDRFARHSLIFKEKVKINLID
ncbi:hypothetical protein [Poseidonibacter ostreae]|uniref:Uncharacterized protein n=1 Tax=Poseidonibacter ostreae TaxID=2654171 RepID=A0A6L4WWY9_9BACT|nr:hypothetical protein [Poseidonibacter ostreae]KAB7891458.1 hypothetical protein GBG19_01055 [Poseidonibacter ostreae]